MKKFFLLFFVFFFFIFNPSFSEDLLNPEDVSGTEDPNAESSSFEDTPDWVKRVEFSWKWETDKKPTFYFQTVQPLYQSYDNTACVFIQPRVSLRDERATYNLGLGYRELVSDSLLLGVNIFGDYEDLHEHGRIGLGLEALGEILEARLNGYVGVTTKRVISQTSSGVTTYEKVADGLDFELGAPIPYMPWLKVYASSFWYDFAKFNDKHGWKARLEATLNDAVTLELFTWDDNKGGQEYGGRFRFNLAFDGLADFKSAFALSDEPFPKKDLTEQILIPVERDFDITVEKWSESATMSVEIGRGT